jgi:hypothetical protein
LLDATIPEIKAALHRGHTRLRELSRHVKADTLIQLGAQERELLARYIERFNARDAGRRGALGSGKSDDPPGPSSGWRVLSSL